MSLSWCCYVYGPKAFRAGDKAWTRPRFSSPTPGTKVTNLTCNPLPLRCRLCLVKFTPEEPMNSSRYACLSVISFFPLPSVYFFFFSFCVTPVFLIFFAYFFLSTLFNPYLLIFSSSFLLFVFLSFSLPIFCFPFLFPSMYLSPFGSSFPLSFSLPAYLCVTVLSFHHLFFFVFVNCRWVKEEGEAQEQDQTP